MPCLRLSRGMAKDIMTTDGCGIRRSVLAALIKAQPKAGRILVGAAFASAWIVAVATAGAGLAQVRIGAGNPRHADALPRCLAADMPEYSGSAHRLSLYVEQYDSRLTTGKANWLAAEWMS